MAFEGNSPGSGGGGGGGGAGDASAANQAILNAAIGSATSTAATTDTGSFSLISLIKRMLTKLTPRQSAGLNIINGTIAVANVAQIGLPVNTDRVALDIKNTSANTLWVNWLGPAAVGAGAPIEADQTWSSHDTWCPTGVISILSQTAGDTFVIIEG